MIRTLFMDNIEINLKDIMYILSNSELFLKVFCKLHYQVVKLHWKSKVDVKL